LGLGLGLDLVSDCELFFNLFVVMHTYLYHFRSLLSHCQRNCVSRFMSVHAWKKNLNGTRTNEV